MKKLIYILLLALSFANLFSQDDDGMIPKEGPDSLGVYVVVDEMPEFKGGMKGLSDFLRSNINLPSGSKGGKVFTRLVINPDGSVTSIKILRSSGEIKLDEEAMRVIKLMPNWAPGKLKNKAVPTYYNMPINFKV